MLSDIGTTVACLDTILWQLVALEAFGQFKFLNKWGEYFKMLPFSLLTVKDWSSRPCQDHRGVGGDERSRCSYQRAQTQDGEPGETSGLATEGWRLGGTEEAIFCSLYKILCINFFSSMQQSIL